MADNDGKSAPVPVSVIAEIEMEAGMNSLSNSKAIFIGIILLYIFCGTVFYKLYDHMSWTDAYYFSVNSGFRIGYTTPESDIDNFSRVFSVFFKLGGVCILAFFYTVLLRSSYFQRADVRYVRLMSSLLATVIILIIGTLWSYLAMDWNMVNSVYFVFSTCFWWGVYSAPTDSSWEVLFITATFAVIGGLAVFVFFTFLVADVEVYIENYLLKRAAAQSITPAELGIVEKLLRKEKEARDIAAQQEQVKREEDLCSDRNGREEEEEEEAPLIEEDLPLSEDVVKHLLLLRVLSLEDVSIIYYQVRMWLLGVFAACLVLGTLFYKFYDGTDYWCLALNFCISSLYRLGNSNADVDSFSQIVSTLTMLVGCFLFNLLNVCITREFGLKARDIRYFHTILDGILCLTLCSLTITMFLDEYGWTGVESFEFAVDIMLGYGDSVPFSESVWSYWLLDTYTIAIIPLFVAYVGHVEVELDIGDALGYMNRALSVSFDQRDLRLVQIHDDYVDQHYAAANKRLRSSSSASDLSYVEETDLSVSRNEYGTYELHVLLVLRLKDFAREELRSMVREINGQYCEALSCGMEVLPCVADEDLVIDVSAGSDIERQEQHRSTPSTPSRRRVPRRSFSRTKSGTGDSDNDQF